MKTIREVELEEKNKELQDRINKAIEYLENYKDIQAKYVYVDFDLENIDKLLNILKGDNK